MAGSPQGGLFELRDYTSVILPDPRTPFPQHPRSFPCPTSLLVFDANCRRLLKTLQHPHCLRWLHQYVLYLAGAASHLCTGGPLRFDMDFLRALFHAIDMLHPLIDIVVLDPDSVPVTLGKAEWCTRFREFWYDDLYRITDLFPADICMPTFADQRVLANLSMWTSTDPRTSDVVHEAIDPGAPFVAGAFPQKHQTNKADRAVEAVTYCIIDTLAGPRKVGIANAPSGKPHAWSSVVEWMCIQLLGAAGHHTRFCLDFEERRRLCRMWRERLYVIPTLNPPREAHIEAVRAFYFNKPMRAIIAVLDHSLAIVATSPGLASALARSTDGKWTVLTSVVQTVSDALRMVSTSPAISAVKQQFCRIGNLCRKPVNFFGEIGSLVSRTCYKDYARQWCKETPERLAKCMAVMDLLRYEIFPNLTSYRPLQEFGVALVIFANVFAYFGVRAEAAVSTCSILQMLAYGRVGPSVLRTRLVRAAPTRDMEIGLCCTDPRVNGVLWLICKACEMESLIVPVALPTNHAEYQREAVRLRLRSFDLPDTFPCVHSLTYCTLCLENKTVHSVAFIPGAQRRRITCMKDAVDQAEIDGTAHIGCQGVSIDPLSCAGDPERPFAAYCERMPRDRSMTGCREAEVKDIDLRDRAIYFKGSHYRICPGSRGEMGDADDNEDHENEKRGVCGVLFKYDPLYSTSSMRGIICQRCSGRVAEKLAARVLADSHLVTQKDRAARIRALAVAEIDAGFIGSTDIAAVVRQVSYPCGQTSRITTELNNVSINEVRKAMMREAQKRNMDAARVFRRKMVKCTE